MRRLSTRVLPLGLAVQEIFAVCIKAFDVVEARNLLGGKREAVIVSYSREGIDD